MAVLRAGGIDDAISEQLIMDVMIATICNLQEIQTMFISCRIMFYCSHVVVTIKT